MGLCPHRYTAGLLVAALTLIRPFGPPSPWGRRGSGHAWFGGDPRGSFTQTVGLDASRVMVRFFLAERAPRGPSFLLLGEKGRG